MKIFHSNQYIKIRSFGRKVVKWTKRSILSAGVITLAGWLIYGGTVYEKMNSKPQIVEAQVTVEVPIETPSPVMDRIAQCESGSSQIAKNGQVLIKTNVNGTTDIGYYQINSVWGAQATKLGYDLSVEKDNKAFAMWLYKNSGTEPWYPSKACWNK